MGMIKDIQINLLEHRRNLICLLKLSNSLCDNLF